MTERAISHYQIVPVYEPEEASFMLVNASVGTCGLCGGTATGMGGSDDQLCTRCAEVVIAGKARGAIVWEEGGDDG